MTARTRLHALLFGLFALVVPSWALAADGDASHWVQERQTALYTLLRSGDADGVDAAMDAMLDYDALARDSLGKHWDDLSEAQRGEFQDVLKKLVRASYRKNLKKTLDYDIAFNGEGKAKKDGVVVHTVAKSRKNKREEPFDVDYAVHDRAGSMAVYDIVTEGSSLVSNYRSQFSRVIKKDGFDGLMKKMRRRLAQS